MSIPHAATIGSEGDGNVAQVALADERVRIGEWRHYKGDYYIVFAVSIQEDTLEPLVHYYSIKHKTRWTRTLKNFTEIVKGAPYKDSRRFEFVNAAKTSTLLEACGLHDILAVLRKFNDFQTFISGVD